MLGSAIVRDRNFHDRAVAETRALVADGSKINGRAWTPLGLVLRSQVKESDPLLLPDDGQAGSNPKVRLADHPRSDLFQRRFDYT
jgi:hypothetical protein